MSGPQSKTRNRNTVSQWLLWTGLALLAVAVAAQWLRPQSALIDPDDSKAVDRGRQVYAKHCASCHGAGLEGQPNWRERRADGRLPAPPHDETGHTWHHPDAVLFGITKEGMVPGRYAPQGYASDMPAFGTVLSDAEIRAVLAFIKSTWPPRARAYQQDIERQTALAENEMMNGMTGMMFGMGLLGWLAVVAVLLVCAAAIKYLFFDRGRDK